MSTPMTTADTAATTPQQSDATISGVKLNFTAKGYIQPEITTRYGNVYDALLNAVHDAFTLYDQTAEEAHKRGLKLVTEVEGK